MIQKLRRRKKIRSLRNYRRILYQAKRNLENKLTNSNKLHHTHNIGQRNTRAQMKYLMGWYLKSMTLGILRATISRERLEIKKNVAHATLLASFKQSKQD